jgi:hypothetical protein
MVIVPDAEAIVEDGNFTSRCGGCAADKQREAKDRRANARRRRDRLVNSPVQLFVLLGQISALGGRKFARRLQTNPNLRM